MKWPSWLMRFLRQPSPSDEYRSRVGDRIREVFADDRQEKAPILLGDHSSDNASKDDRQEDD